MKKHKFEKIIKQDPWVLRLLRHYLVPCINPDEKIDPKELDKFVENGLHYIVFRPFQRIVSKGFSKCKARQVHHTPKLHPSEIARRKKIKTYAFFPSDWHNALEVRSWSVHGHFEGEEVAFRENQAWWGEGPGREADTLLRALLRLRDSAATSTKLFIVDAVVMHHRPGRGDTRVRIEIYRVVQNIDTIPLE